MDGSFVVDSWHSFFYDFSDTSRSRQIDTLSIRYVESGKTVLIGSSHFRKFDNTGASYTNPDGDIWIFFVVMNIGSSNDSFQNGCTNDGTSLDHMT